MPQATVTLRPGVNADVTETANQAGISASNLIRFRDGLPEKIGGWAPWNGVNVGSPVRALWAWEDLNGNNYLAVGAVNSLQYVEVQTDGSTVTVDITPQAIETDNAPQFSTTVGSGVVTILDPGTNVTSADVIVFEAPVSVGGLVVRGSFYVSTPQGPDKYQITVPGVATSTVVNGGSLPVYATVQGSNAITVTLENHGYSVGDTYAAGPSTPVGGLTVFGLYSVTQVRDADNFVINASINATSAGTATVNGGKVPIRYWVTPVSQSIGAGYGVGGYGMGGYGRGVQPPPRFGVKITATDYCLDNWGQDLVVIPEGDGVFIWAPNSTYLGARLLQNAPVACTGGFVAMPEQQIVVYGAAVDGFVDPLLVAWCDAGNFEIWTDAVDNQAGSYRIPRGSKIVGGLQGPTQGLLWTDLALWTMAYEGYPNVYGFNEIASGCGLIAKKAAAVYSTQVFWMSQTAFFVYSGGGVAPQPCPVWDVVFQNLNKDHLANIRAAANSRFGEVEWFYPSLASASGENDSYVKLNVVTGEWDYGLMSRSAWLNQSVLGAPLGADATGAIYQHEVGHDANGAALTPAFETGYFQINEGEDFVFVDKVIPDFKWRERGGSSPSAQIKITLLAYEEPDDGDPAIEGPITVTQATPFFTPRIRGRYFKMRIESSDLGSFWRMGATKFRYSLDGRR